MIAYRQVREKVLQVLSLNHSLYHPIFLIPAERQGEDIPLGIFFLWESKVTTFHTVT